MGNLRFKTKNQEPRLAQESLGNLGSWFLVLGNLRFKSLGNLRFKNQTKICSGVFGESWFLVLGSWFWFGNSKICSGVFGESWFLVLGSGSEIQRFVQESWANLGSWF